LTLKETIVLIYIHSYTIYSFMIKML